MAGQRPLKRCQQGTKIFGDSINPPREIFYCKREWYFTKEQIIHSPPSRNDGINVEMESELRKKYCTFLRDLGMKLKLPQVTIASSILLCHRFYMLQSHAKNDWQTVATSSLFLACKIEDVPRLLKDVIVAAYEILYKWDPSAAHRIKQRDFYEKQKELTLIGERLILATIAFDFDIQLPYQPLVAAIKKLNILKDLANVAWKFVNDWLCTTLCLQFKPPYIAAASLLIAAKFKKIKLPVEKDNVWMEFQISPKILDEVIQQVIKILEGDKNQAPPPPKHKTVSKITAPSPAKQSNSSPESCISNGSVTESHSCIKSTAVDTTKISKPLASCYINVDAREVSHCLTSDISDNLVDNKVVSTTPCTNSMVVVDTTKFGEPLVSGDMNVVGAMEVSSCPSGDISNKLSDEKHLSSVAICNKSTVVDIPKFCEPLALRDINVGATEVSRCSISEVSDDKLSEKKVVSINNMYKKIDTDRIQALKRKRCDQLAKTKTVKVKDDEMGSEAWIERELENGILLE